MRERAPQGAPNAQFTKQMVNEQFLFWSLVLVLCQFLSEGTTNFSVMGGQILQLTSSIK